MGNKRQIMYDEEPSMKLKPGMWTYEYRVLSAKKFYPENLGSFKVNYLGNLGNGLAWEKGNDPKSYIHSWTSENEQCNEDGIFMADWLIRKANYTNTYVRKVVFTFLEEGYLLGHFYDIKNNGFIGDIGIIRARHKQTIEEVADEEIEDDDDDKVNLLDIED